jgi:hypothetical protein
MEQSVARQNVSAGTEYDELDNFRDNLRFESFDPYVKEQDSSSAKSLAKSLDHGRKRLFQMEEALFEAKKKREAGMHILTEKHSKMLSTVVENMALVSDKEAYSTIEWDQEWEERMSSFHIQHREMESALKSRHLVELKKIEGDIQRNIRRIASDIQNTKNCRIPSPRSLTVLQEENMGRIITLFQKQAQERLFLGSKLSKQEELLIRSKHQSLQKRMGEAHVMAGKWYRRFNLPQPNIKRNLISIPAEGSSVLKSIQADHAADEGSEKRLTSQQSRPSISSELIQRGPQPHRMTSTSRSVDSLKFSITTPRLDDESTFLTELNCEEERPGGPSTGFNSAAIQIGDSEPMEVGGDFPETKKPRIVSGGFRPPRNRDMQKTEYIQSVQISNNDPILGAHRAISSGHPLTNSKDESVNWRGSETSVFLDENHESIRTTGISVSKEREGHTTQLNASNISYVSQTTAPVYAPPIIKGGHQASGFKKPTISPYLIPQLNVNKIASLHWNTATRHDLKVSGAVKGRQRGASAHPVENTKSINDGSDITRAASTLPLMNLSQRTTEFTSNAGSNDSRTVFPHLTRPSDTPNITVHTNGISEFALGSGQEKSENVSRLESWIENKIRTILSASSNPLSRSDLHAPRPEHPSLDGKDFSLDVSQSTLNISAANTTVAGDHDHQIQNRLVLSRPVKIPDDSSNGEIGNLMMRLRATMVTEQAVNLKDIVPRPKILPRNGFEKAPTAAPNEGLGFFNPKERRSDLSNKKDHFQGQDVKQEETDPPISAFASTVDEEERYAQKEKERRGKEDERRSRLDQVNGKNEIDCKTTAHIKEAKKVGWSLPVEDTPKTEGEPSQALLVHSDSNGFLNPGTSQLSLTAMSRPETSTSSASGFESRPETSEALITDETFNLERDFFSLVRHNKVSEFEEALKRTNLPIDSRDQHGNTAVMIAAQNGHKRLVKLCLLNNSDLNTSNHQGNTALHYALSYGYTTVANYLISKGADDTLINHQGKTCYEK